MPSCIPRLRKTAMGKIPEPHFNYRNNPRKPSGKNSPSVLKPEKQRDAPSRKRKPPLPASFGGRIYPKPLFNQVHRQLRAQAQFVIGVMSESLKRGQGSFRTDFPKIRAAERFNTKSSDSFSERMISASPVGPAALHSSSPLLGILFPFPRSNAKLLFSEPCSKT